MAFSDEMLIVLAKGLNNRGIVTPALVKSVYSSEIKPKVKIQSMIARGFLVPSSTGRFKIKVEKEGERYKTNIPQEAIDMARNMRISEKEKDKFEKTFSELTKKNE